MGRSGRALWGCGLLLATWVAAPAHARGDDAERQARRHELRQQLQAERERWRGDERGRGPGGPGAPGYGAPPGYGPPPGYRAPPAYAPSPGAGPPPGWGGGHRLTPDERRALRQELRQQRP